MAKKKKKLELNELLEIEKFHSSQLGRDLQKKNLELKKQLLISKKQCLIAQIQLIDKDLKILEDVTLKIVEEQNNKIDEYKKIKKNIQKRLNLSDRFGYDDQTGEIIEE